MNFLNWILFFRIYLGTDSKNVMPTPPPPLFVNCLLSFRSGLGVHRALYNFFYYSFLILIIYKNIYLLVNRLYYFITFIWPLTDHSSTLRRPQKNIKNDCIIQFQFIIKCTPRSWGKCHSQPNSPSTIHSPVWIQFYVRRWIGTFNL